MWAICCLAFFWFFTLQWVHSPFTKKLRYSHAPFIVILQSMTVIIPLWLWFTSKYPRWIFLQRTSIILDATRNEICPVKALILYLKIWGSQAGPLFICENQQFLTQQAFQSHLTKLLQDLNVDPSCYNTHSFRIGAATSAEGAGLTESQFITLADGEAMLTTVISSQRIPS